VKSFELTCDSGTTGLIFQQKRPFPIGRDVVLASAANVRFPPILWKNNVLQGIRPVSPL
jgi:hypothetical protein